MIVIITVSWYSNTCVGTWYEMARQRRKSRKLWILLQICEKLNRAIKMRIPCLYRRRHRKVHPYCIFFCNTNYLVTIKIKMWELEYTVKVSLRLWKNCAHGKVTVQIHVFRWIACEITAQPIQMFEQSFFMFPQHVACRPYFHRHYTESGIHTANCRD